MSGFFMIDTDDFTERMGDKSMASCFHVLCILKYHAWRQPFPANRTVKGVQVCLRQGQLIYCGTKLADNHGYCRSTFCSNVSKLVESGEVRIENVAPTVQVLTILRTYTYDPVIGRQMCEYEQESVTGSSPDHQQFIDKTTPELDNTLCSNALRDPYTDTLRDSETERRRNEDTERLTDTNMPIPGGKKKSETNEDLLEIGGHTLSRKQIEDGVSAILSERPDLTPLVACNIVKKQMMERGTEHSGVP